MFHKEKSTTDLYFAKHAADSRDFPYRLSGTIARPILATLLACFFFLV